MAKSNFNFGDSVDKMISNIPKKRMSDWHKEQYDFMEKQVGDQVEGTIPRIHEEKILETNLESSNIDFGDMSREIMRNRQIIKDMGPKSQHIIIGLKLKYMVEEINLKLNNQSIENDLVAKKITVRDFVESAIYSYIEKFNMQ